MFGIPFKYLIIKDKNNQILASGKIAGRKTISEKYEFNHVSVDGRYFFNLDSKDFIFEFKNSVVEEKIFDGSLEYTEWADSFFKPNQNIYRDKDIDELDEEVKLLVKCLNRITGVTTIGSCCGHGEKILYVDFIISDLSAIAKLEYLISHYYIDDFDLLYDSTRFIVDGNIVLTLQSKKIGEEAFRASDSLAEKILETVS